MRRSADGLEWAEYLLWFLNVLKGKTKTHPVAVDGMVVRGKTLVRVWRHRQC